MTGKQAYQGLDSFLGFVKYFKKHQPIRSINASSEKIHFIKLSKSIANQWELRQNGWKASKNSLIVNDNSMAISFDNLCSMMSGDETKNLTGKESIAVALCTQLCFWTQVEKP